MNIDTLLVYLLVAFFYITSPGPAVILAIINGLRTNMKVVAIPTFANTLGLAILSTASILGLGVLLTTSATLFMIVKFVGAFYLVYLGVMVNSLGGCPREDITSCSISCCLMFNSSSKSLALSWSSKKPYCL